MEYFKFLPAEIAVDILSRVPTEWVLECKSVCKTWNYLVSHHPSFSKMHLYHLNHTCADSGKLSFLALDYMSIGKFRYFEYNENHDQSTTPIERVRRIKFTSPFTSNCFFGSCNGLICFGGCRSLSGDMPVCICNPVTREYVMLSEIKRDCCDADQYVRRENAFGYVSSTNEYKIMGIIFGAGFSEVYIYTLGSGRGWRNIGKFNFKFSPYRVEPGFLANETLYWMSAEPGMIFTFDLSKEIFRENLSTPPLPAPSNIFWPYNSIGVLDGFLFYADLLHFETPPCFEIWILRKKNDNKEQEEHQSFVWSKEFRVQRSGSLLAQLLAVTSDGVLTYESPNLDIYDTEALNSKTLVKLKEQFSKVYSHKNTLVSLKELGEEDAKIVDSVEEDREP